MDECEYAAISSWIRENAVPLASVEAGSGFADLQPLKAVLAGATVVGLGEATHGTREFFQCKHRLVEFLVRELGFTTFIIEASYAACVRINEYVLHGQNDPAEALAGQKFWTWDTEEVATMIEWMRQYNLTQPEAKKVRFCGNDVQHVSLAIDMVRAYLARVAPDRAALTDAALAPVEETQRVRDAIEGNADSVTKAEGIARLLTLVGYLNMHRTRLIRLTSAAEYENVLQHARLMVQFEECYGKPLDQTSDARDRYMAENTEYIVKHLAPGAKAIVWAHNAHIKKHSGVHEGTPVYAQGHYMADIFGPAYYALGFSFNQGSFQSRQMKMHFNDDNWFTAQGALVEFTVEPAPEGYIDWYLANARTGNYIIDFRGAPCDPAVTAWLASEKRQRSMGSCYSSEWPEDSRTECHVPIVFDGMIFIERTTRSRPTPTGMRY